MYFESVNRCRLVWGQDCSARDTAATSAMLFEDGRPASRTDSWLPDVDTHAEAVIQSSRPLFSADPSVYTSMVSLAQGPSMWILLVAYLKWRGWWKLLATLGLP